MGVERDTGRALAVDGEEIVDLGPDTGRLNSIFLVALGSVSLRSGTRALRLAAG